MRNLKTRLTGTLLALFLAPLLVLSQPSSTEAQIVITYPGGGGGGGGGTIGGTIASGQVAVGSGADTIGGSASFLFNSAANLATTDFWQFSLGPGDGSMPVDVQLGSLPAETLITANVTGWQNGFGAVLGLEGFTSDNTTILNGVYLTEQAAGGYSQGFRSVQLQSATTSDPLVGGTAGFISSQNYLNGATGGNLIGFWYYAPDVGAAVRTAFYSDAVGGLATNAYSFWSDEAGVFRIKADNTFDAVYQAIPALYNPQFTKYTPGAADYERIVLGQWNGNVAEIGTQTGVGVSVLRPLRFIGASVSTAAVFQAGGYKSSDGTAGMTGSCGAATTAVIKNGLVVSCS